MIKKEIQRFLTALMFFTCLPCPKWTAYSDELMYSCTRYFPLIGIVIGSIGAGIFYLCSLIFPFSIAIMLSMVSTVLATGAMHEDGLADACDAFGGGWTKEKILMIMTDSRLGTFGTVGLLGTLSLKYCCLTQMPPRLIIPSLIVAHSLSRCAAVTMLYNLPYVRNTSDGKSKPAMKKMSSKSLIIASIWGVLPLLLYKNAWAFLVLLPMLAVMFLLTRYFKKWIGGQTGDCGGAAQQICEIVFYLFMLALWKFI